MALAQIAMSARRGDTWESQKFTLFDQDIPPGITKKELEAGISRGEYTYQDWNQYEINADVKIGGVDGTPWFILTDYMRIEGDSGRYLVFEMTAAQTAALETTSGGETLTLPTSGAYDLQICKAGEVRTIFGGSFSLEADITEREPCV